MSNVEMSPCLMLTCRHVMMVVHRQASSMTIVRRMTSEAQGTSPDWSKQSSTLVNSKNSIQNRNTSLVSTVGEHRWFAKFQQTNDVLVCWNLKINHQILARQKSGDLVPKTLGRHTQHWPENITSLLRPGVTKLLITASPSLHFSSI